MNGVSNRPAAGNRTCRRAIGRRLVLTVTAALAVAVPGAAWAGGAATQADGDTFAPTATWVWTDGPSLGTTCGSDQWASATVSGLTDADHNAGFRLRAGSGDVLVGLSGTAWKIEPSNGTATGGALTVTGPAQLRVSISAADVVTIQWNGTVVATRTVAGAPSGREIKPTVWQSSVGVSMTGIKSNTGSCATPTPTVSQPSGVPDAVTGMTVSDPTDTTLRVAWQAPGSSPVTAYKVGWTEVGTGRSWDSGPPHYTAAQSPVTLTGLLPGNNYSVRVTAVNNAGDGPVTTATGTTTGGGNGGGGTTSPAPMPYPAKAVAVYYMMWASSGSPRLADLPRDINVLNLAFAQGDPPRLVDWGPEGKSAFVSGITALRERGVRIVLSVGGSGGQINVANRTGFVDGVMAINADVPLDGLDWDLEGPALTQSDVVAVSTELKRRRGADFAITMAPNGGNVDTYIPVAKALYDADALDLIAQQFYDAPVSLSAADGRINQMIGANIPVNRIGIGMMIANDANHWTLAQCVSNTQQLKARHPSLRGGYLWEAGRADTAGWVDQVGAILRQ